jgi:hypothetical protein
MAVAHTTATHFPNLLNCSRDTRDIRDSIDIA